MQWILIYIIIDIFSHIFIMFLKTFYLEITLMEDICLKKEMTFAESYLIKGK